MSEMATTENKNRGVLIIALGHTFYGNLAANLAATIKSNSPDLPIQLVWAGEALNHLKPDKMALFDEVVECPHDFYHRKGRVSYVKAKVMMYELSVFDETIFIDADVALTPRKPFTELFDILAPHLMTFENRARINLADDDTPDDAYLWGSWREIKKAYELNDGFLYGLHSEFIYFKKCDKVREFFDTAVEVFENPKAKIVEFNGDLPDEFAFAIAMAKCRFYPHAYPYKPFYWQLTDKHLGTSLGMVLENFYGYSVGGNNTPPNVIKNYNNLVQAASRRVNVQHPYKLRPKKSVLASRIKM